MSVAGTFVEDLAARGGIRLVEGGADSPILLELTSGFDGSDSLNPTHGVSPIGATADSERYRLCVTAEGVHVQGTTPEAIWRGLTSLRQLVDVGAGESSVDLPAVEIVDGPRYAWRGLSLDVVRTCFTVDEVKLVIDRAGSTPRLSSGISSSTPPAAL